MDPIGWLGHILLDPLGRAFFLRALIAAILVGTVCAVVGTYVVLKGLAFIGDAVSHAAFPGVVAAFLLGANYFVGAAVAAVGTALSIGFVSRRTQLRLDTTVGVVFAGTFALGIFLYSTIHGFVMDLMGLLFGNVLLISFNDLLGLVVLGLLVLAVIVVLWYVFLAVVALTIVVSLKAVGIILVVAMLVTPAATAQLLTVRFGRMMALAIVVGIVSAVIGLYVSLWADAASGATIVLIETALFLAAMTLGPRTGLLAKLRRAD
jgi:ABC-type Mn2+/Zn2+ transport system permease subunit